MRSKYILTLLIIFISASLSTINSQTLQHFTFTSNTGNNASIIIQTSANPNINGAPLESGDEIGVFTPAGLCVGAVVWNDANSSITVWGDNAQTSELDGIVVGEEMSFRVWEQSSNTEISNVNVTYNSNPPFIGNGNYVVNGLYNLLSVNALTITEIINRELSSTSDISLAVSIFFTSSIVFPILLYLKDQLLSIFRHHLSVHILLFLVYVECI